MSRKYLMAGNWKMNHLASDIDGFVSEFSAGVKNHLTDDCGVEVMIAPPFPLIPKLLISSKSIPGLWLASQNVHNVSQGAFTGEVSISMLKDLGVRGSIIGHSERRQYFGEDDALVRSKTLSCLENSFTPIVCCGESLEERDSGNAEQVVEEQISGALNGVRDLSTVVIAYEPVWAIGTGRSATAGQAQEMHGFIRTLLTKLFSKEAAQKTKILYGGSMNEGNVEDLLKEKDIDGGLIGGASLKPQAFSSMIRTAVSLAK